MAKSPRNPRILIVTPEVTYLPDGMGDIANSLCAKAGGLADVSAALISALFDQGGDVHVALPDYRTIFNGNFGSFLKKELKTMKSRMPEERIHLAQDRIFFYLDNVYSSYEVENTKMALIFQREVINNIVPKVIPDLIHCNDWMTGLIPAMARELGIPCLFSIHNIHTVKKTLADIEDNGIDAKSFWKQLFFEHMPHTYEETRYSIPVDFLGSGIFAAYYVNTVSPTFLMEMIEGRHDFVDEPIRRELANKWNAGCAVGILNAPELSFAPDNDEALTCTYSINDHVSGKQENKRFLQKHLGLIQDVRAPIFFWPSRLDTIQKGCQLLAEILYDLVSCYWERNLEIVFVAGGDFQKHFKEIVSRFNLNSRVAICDFDEQLARQAFGASDFVLMPSRFEPCGLPQMIGPTYGTLPVAHDTGGIHDTITDIDVTRNTGNGFLFKHFDSNGLFWAINQAMQFYDLSPNIKEQQIRRIMAQSTATFNHSVTAAKYIDLYERMLQRPFINPRV
ncbi:MAG: glycogen/starch synthase [Desulfobacterales bacterium]